LQYSYHRELSEAAKVGDFSTSERASYFMHRLVIAARVQPDLLQPVLELMVRLWVQERLNCLRLLILKRNCRSSLVPLG
jgi:hypothetical protein